jgi:hypothetical protein
MTTNRHKPRALNTRLLCVLSLAIAAIVGIVIVVAIFYRPGGFSVVAQGQGNSLEFKFADSRVDLGEILDQLLKQADDAPDPASKRRLIALTLQAHGFYNLPSIEAVRALREIKETDQTREFVRAVRAMLYDLDGPFSRPATFVEAPDDRVLLAIYDLFESKPSSPLLATLWEMSLEMNGVFALRDVQISIREDKGLKNRVAATCHGSILLGRVGVLRTDEEKQPIEIRVDEGRPCAPTSPQGLIAGKRTPVWISPSDLNDLIGGTASTSDKELHATLMPLPKDLITTKPER